MGSVYKRGKRWYIQFKDPRGNWVTRSAANTKAEAQQILRQVERGVKDMIKARGNEAPLSPPLSELAEKWLARRQRRGLRNAPNDRSHLTNHVLPLLGDKPVKEIRVKHIRDLVESLQQKELAPRTVRKIYGTVHKLFADLVVDEEIDHTPCVLTKDQLPKNRDKDPEWRAGAVFARDEAEILISSTAIPADRLVLYYLLFLTGCRFGEVAGLRWRDIDTRAEPLQRLNVARSYDHSTKTEIARPVPVHPTLASVLAEWRLSGFAELMGIRQVRTTSLCRLERVKSVPGTRPATSFWMTSSGSGCAIAVSTIPGAP